MKPKFTPKNVPPGKYLLRREGFQDVVVDVRFQGGRLIEIHPSGYRCSPGDNPDDATYESVEVVTPEPAEVAK